MPKRQFHRKKMKKVRNNRMFRGRERRNRHQAYHPGNRDGEEMRSHRTASRILMHAGAWDNPKYGIVRSRPFFERFNGKIV